MVAMPRIIRHLAAASLPLAAGAAGALAVAIAVQLPARRAYDSAVPAVGVPRGARAGRGCWGAGGGGGGCFPRRRGERGARGGVPGGARGGPPQRQLRPPDPW